MQYLLLIYGNESADKQRSADEQNQLMRDYAAFNQQLREASALVAGDALQTTDTATTVRMRGGERLVTDGPFAETKEQLAGYYLLECANLDEAIKWGERCPGAKTGSVELRPILDVKALMQRAGVG